MKSYLTLHKVIGNYIELVAHPTLMQPVLTIEINPTLTLHFKSC